MSKLTTPKGPATSEYSSAVASGITDDQRDVMRRPTWVPPKWAPSRPGADDHKQYQSRGTR